MTVVDAWTDAIGLIEQWIDADATLRQTLTLGATQERKRSPGRGTYALLTWAGGGNALISAETPSQRVLVGINVNSVAYQPAVNAAVALCSAFDNLHLDRPTVDGWQLLFADDVTGPLTLSRDSQGAELYVSATVHLQPAT